MLTSTRDTASPRRDRSSSSVVTASSTVSVVVLACYASHSLPSTQFKCTLETLRNCAKSSSAPFATPCPRGAFPSFRRAPHSRIVERSCRSCRRSVPVPSGEGWKTGRLPSGVWVAADRSKSERSASEFCAAA